MNPACNKFYSTGSLQCDLNSGNVFVTKQVLLFFSLITDGPTVPIKSKLPPLGTRTPPRVSQKENKTDDKLFEFLNSIPSSKERKPAKPKIFIESSSEVIPKQNETVDLMPNDATDVALKEG